MKRLTAICLVLSIVLLTFAGCEKEQSVLQTSSSTNSDDYVWQAEFHTTELNNFQLEHPFVVDDSVYFFQTIAVDVPQPKNTEVEDNSSESNNDFNVVPSVTYETRLYAIKVDSSDHHEINGFVPSKPPQESSVFGAYSVTAAELAPDTSAIVVEYGSFSYLDSAGQWVFSHSTIMRKIDLSTGKTIQLFDVTALEGAYPNIIIDHIASSGDGSLVTASRYSDNNNRQLLLFSIFDTSGNYLTTYEHAVGMQSLRLIDLVSLPDGRIVALINNEKANELRTIDVKTGELQKSIGTLPPYFSKIVGFTRNDEFIACTASGAEYAMLGDSVGGEYANWLDCDLDPYSVNFLGTNNDEIYLSAVNFGTLGMTTDIITVKRVPKSKIKQKTILTLACIDAKYNIQRIVLGFNRSNSDYRIKVIDYVKYNTDGDTSAGLTKLNTEIISGNVPDILLLDNLPFSVYAARGVLEDLYPFIDADEELGERDSILPAILNATRSENGALHRVAAFFAINSVISNSRISGTANGWSMEDLNNILAQNSGMKAFSQYTSRSDILQQILQNNLGEYVDWQTGNVNFDSEEFIHLIEYVKQFPDVVDNQYIDFYQANQELVQIVKGERAAGMVLLSDFNDLMENAALFDNEEVYKGFPCVSRHGSSFTLSDTMGMTTLCKDKAGAWEFIRTILSIDYQLLYPKSFPTNKDFFGRQIVGYMTSTYLNPIYDENGDLDLSAMSGEPQYCRINEDGTIEGPRGFASVIEADYQSTYIPYYNMTQEQLLRFMGFIDSIDHVQEQDDNLSAIITEELAPFFAGQKDAESTVKVIQSRVTIYVNERK